MTSPLTNIGPGNILCMLSAQEIGWAAAVVGANFGFRVWWQQNFWLVQTLAVSSILIRKYSFLRKEGFLLFLSQPFMFQEPWVSGQFGQLCVCGQSCVHLIAQHQMVQVIC